MDFPVTANTRLKTVAQFKQLPIKVNQGQIVHLGDIANVKLGGATNSTSAMYINGQPGVMLQLYSQDSASEIDVANKVKHALVQIRQQLPEGMKITVFFNNSSFLKQAIHEVYLTILMAIACVLIAVFLFLGSFRAILIPIATIPICLIGSFAIMYALDYSINVITLLALVLSIGLVVDDAIVMLENIYRHIESGLDSMAAAFKGSKQIAFAVIGMTASIVAVYLPVGLLHGRIATIFREFAFTLAGAVLVSGFVALTLSPMMCSRLLSSTTLQTGFANWLENFFEKLAKAYQTALKFILTKRLTVVIIVILLAAGGGFIFKSLPEQFMPSEDMGFFISVLNAPTGSSFSYLKNQANTVNNLLQQQPAIQSTATILSDQAGSFNAVFSVLKPYQDRDVSAQALAQQLTQTGAAFI